MSAVFENASERSRSLPSVADSHMAALNRQYERGFSAGERWGYVQGTRRGTFNGLGLAVCVFVILKVAGVL